MDEFPYHAIPWPQEPKDLSIEIAPGNPNTTLDRSAIADHEAQSVLNCSNATRVLRLSDRCRQFAPSPVRPLTTSCAISSPNTVMLRFSGGCPDETSAFGVSHGLVVAACTPIGPGTT